jgi:Phospholipase_D-nuclease N-terminal
MFGREWYDASGFAFALALVLALWAVFHIAQSRSTPLAKAVWIVVVLFLPFFGFLAWLFFGPRSAR